MYMPVTSSRDATDLVSEVPENDFLKCAIFGSSVGCIPDYVGHDEKGEYRTCGVCTAVYHKLVGLHGNPVDVNIYVNEHNIKIGYQMTIAHKHMKYENNRIADQIKKLQDAHFKNSKDSTVQIKALFDQLEKK